VAALVFGLLYAYLPASPPTSYRSRTLALLHHLRARGERPAAWVHLPGRLRLPSWAFALAAAALSLQTVTLMRTLFRLSHTQDAGRHAEGRALAAALPVGATVAATWPEAEMYVYYAPQARFPQRARPRLHAARDPCAMSSRSRSSTAASRTSPMPSRSNLASDYVALSQVEPQGASARLFRDPRILVRRRGYFGLFELRPARERSLRPRTGGPRPARPTPRA
jgi:hypothetical protein